MPQKSTRNPGASTSGIADSGCFWLDELVRVTGVEIFLEAAPQSLAFDREHAARRARLESQHVHRCLPAAVAARVTLRFAQTTQPPHEHRVRRTSDGSCHVKAKEFRYSIALDRAGRVTADGQAPEHLVLEGLARCTLESLRFHAARAEVDFVASATAAGVVTRPAPGERYAFVEIDVDLDVEAEPLPSDAALRELLELAERDCFVGASLRPHPNYRWRVNGRSL
jgi:organic hydroperoxide reductase OsmC/OhrA